jgi:Icc protein
MTAPGQGETIRVLQITDTHLYASSGGCLLGLNTAQSLEAVMAEARRRHLPADLVLATGDLVHDGSAAAYQRFFGLLGSLGIPVYCLAGNHDEAVALRDTIDNRLIRYTDHALLGNWHFILLDSSQPDSEGGHLGPAALETLEARLQAAPDTHTLVCLHHQPVLMGSRWLDTMAIDNPDDFFAIIDRHPQVRGILWGHVHQESDRMRNDVRLLSTPSTCIQFMPGSTEFALDDTAPGYRWLTLHEDGRIETGIKRLAEIPGTIDLESAGY